MVLVWMSAISLIVLGGFLILGTLGRLIAIEEATGKGWLVAALLVLGGGALIAIGAGTCYTIKERPYDICPITRPAPLPEATPP